MQVSPSCPLSTGGQSSDILQGLSAWRLHNDLIGTAVAYGLHCSHYDSKVTLQSETMKRLSACIFWSDKEISMFTARPPSLSLRYFSCPLPVDLDTDTLMAGGEMHSNFPVQLEVSKADLSDCADDKIMLRLLCGRLDYLRVHFLLERLSTERGGAGKSQLFEVAREMLDLTVFLWVQRDRTMDRVHDYDYMVYHLQHH
jgi:hypothetical protein